MKSTAKRIPHPFRENRPKEVATKAPVHDIEWQRRRVKQEKLLDGALEDTFPASDPVSSLSVAS